MLKHMDFTIVRFLLHGEENSVLRGMTIFRFRYRFLMKTLIKIYGAVLLLVRNNLKNLTGMKI